MFNKQVAGQVYSTRLARFQAGKLRLGFRKSSEVPRICCANREWGESREPTSATTPREARLGAW